MRFIELYTAVILVYMVGTGILLISLSNEHTKDTTPLIVAFIWPLFFIKGFIYYLITGTYYAFKQLIFNWDYS